MKIYVGGAKHHFFFSRVKSGENWPKLAGPFPSFEGGRETSARDALEGKGPQRRPQKRLDRRLEEVAKAVGGGSCQLQMPLKLALGIRGTMAGHRLGTWKGRGGTTSPPNASLAWTPPHTHTHTISIPPHPHQNHLVAIISIAAPRHVCPLALALLPSH